MPDSTDREGAAERAVGRTAGAPSGDVGGRVETDSMLDPEDLQDLSQGCDGSSGWLPEPGSGWSVDELEALVRDGVPVVQRGPAPCPADGEETRPAADAPCDWVPEPGCLGETE